jgi:hypothetical protein
MLVYQQSSIQRLRTIRSWLTLGRKLFPPNNIQNLKTDAYLPGIGQGDNMINVQITGSSPGGSVVWRDPFPTAGRAAATILNHAGAVSLQHNIARVAATGGRGENF